MPLNKFTPKVCTRFYDEKCLCKDCIANLSLKNDKKCKKCKTCVRINTYGLKFLEGLPPFYISKL